MLSLCFYFITNDLQPKSSNILANITESYETLKNNLIHIKSKNNVEATTVKGFLELYETLKNNLMDIKSKNNVEVRVIKNFPKLYETLKTI